MKFDDMVPSQDEIEALFLEDFSFAIHVVIEGTVMPSDDDLGDPPSKNPHPKSFHLHNLGAKLVSILVFR